MSAIETLALRKTFGKTLAVDNVSLSVGQGEVFGFLGPNGAGKTTTLKMLLGLVRPTDGIAQVLGFPLGVPDVMGQVGFLPENFRFHPWLTAREFLDFHGRLYRMSPGQRRARIPVLLDKVGLSDRAETRLSDFSKGMLQRIGLAQALLNQPRLVFLDEPTSGMDPMGRRLVRSLIRELRADGVTVFINSHLLTEIELTCDRVAFIHRGRVIREGQLDEFHEGEIEVEIRAEPFAPQVYASLESYGRVEAIEAGHLLLFVKDRGVLPEISRMLVQQGVRLEAFTPRRLSLEELFVRIMQAEEAGREHA